MNSKLLLTIFLQILVTKSQSEIKGPPLAREKIVQKIGQIGDTIRLQCPIGGFPTPFYEWKKDGQPVDDITWIRFRKNKSSLKIRNANQDDTGIYHCKGINGFGTDEARVELIVVDQLHHLGSEDGEQLPLAAPVFTSQTRRAERHYRKDVGDIFKVSCEALGSPRPSIRWFKNGQEIHDAVRPSRAGDTNGRSTIELTILGTADDGIYSCRAENEAGMAQHNYTLAVNHGSIRHAIVTEAGPGNQTVIEGNSARLRCKVKSVVSPRIKWLKKLGSGESEIMSLEQPATPSGLDGKVMNVHTFNMGNVKFNVMNSDPDIMTRDGQYMNELVIPNAGLNDAGMYICFVTNSGFGAFTYKSTFLKIIPRDQVSNISVSSASPSDQDNLIVYIIISVIIVTFSIGLVIIICVIKRNQTISKNSQSYSSNQNTSSQLRNDDELVQQRPFLLSNELKYDPSISPASLPHPTHPTSLFQSVPSSTTMGQWSRTVYPAFEGHGRLNKPYGGSSTHYENPHSSPNTLLSPSSNQYEVPYSHLMNRTPSVAGGKSSSGNSNTSLNPLLQSQQQNYPFIGSSFRYPSQQGNQHQQKKQQQQDSPGQEAYPFRNFQYFHY